MVTFKTAAEKAGLTCESKGSLGYAWTAWDDKSREALIGLKPKWSAFNLVRKTAGVAAKGVGGGIGAGIGGVQVLGADGPGSKGKGGGPKKWTCGCQSIYSGRKDLNVICGDCGKPFARA
jgi:hypothetical protein